MFLNNRYYDPATGIFLSVDPLVASTGDPYLYAGGNPTTLSDPLGLCAVTQGMHSYDDGKGPCGGGGSHGSCAGQCQGSVGDANEIGLSIQERRRVVDRFTGDDGLLWGARDSAFRNIRDFMDWEIESGRVVDGPRGSAWWESVNGHMIADMSKAASLLDSAGGKTPHSSDPSVQAWITSSYSRSAKDFWTAHQLSLHEGIRQSVVGLLGREPAGEQAFAEIVVENVDLTAMSGISPRLGLGKGVDISINYVLNYPDYPARGDPSVHSDAVLMTRDFGTYSNLVAWNVIGLQSIQWRAT